MRTMDAAVRATGAESPVPNTDGAYFTGLINMAGRQRMLSQRIGLILMIAACADPSEQAGHAEALDRALGLFETSYDLIAAGRTDAANPAVALPKLSAYLDKPFPGDSQSVERTLKAFVGQARVFAQRLAQGEGLQLHEVAPFAAQIAGPVLNRIAGIIDCLDADITQILKARAAETAVQRDKVMKAVDRIGQAADTARMISFNARISAARAGEFGREFTALTNEIKTISDDIQSASREILDYVHAI